MLDLEMYSPSAILTLIKMIPLIQRSESLTSEVLHAILTFPLNSLKNITLLNYYTEQIIRKVDKVIKQNKNNTDFLFVGHSLGGGLSKYIATIYKKQSFSISGPGITPLEYMDSISGYNKVFKSNFIDIIPDNDIVPRIDTSGGIKYRVLCNKNSINCHSIDRTICMMGIMCEQEEYTKKLCLSMPNIGEEEYKKMKIFKNGDNFCNDQIIRENEKDKCKSASITSNDYKCCYVHLKLPKNNNEYKHEYKCLQFSSFNEIERYQKEINDIYNKNSKYNYDISEIICE